MPRLRLCRRLRRRRLRGRQTAAGASAPPLVVTHQDGEEFGTGWGGRSLSAVTLGRARPTRAAALVCAWRDEARFVVGHVRRWVVRLPRPPARDHVASSARASEALDHRRCALIVPRDTGASLPDCTCNWVALARSSTHVLGREPHLPRVTKGGRARGVSRESEHGV